MRSRTVNVFCTEASRYCCQGPRAPSIVRGAFPNWPSTGRSKAAGFTYGSHRFVSGQEELQRGLTTDTPETIFGRIEYSLLELLSPRPLLSRITGMKGWPVRTRPTPDKLQLANTALRGLD